MSRTELLGLSPRAYEHPADRAALVALRRVPGFDTVVRKLLGSIGDRSLRYAFLASSVRVSEEQFPEIHNSFLEACRVLDVSPVPELYVAQTPIVNAGAVGVDKPFIVINSGTVSLMSPEELQFILGHELGHVISGHVLYKTMLRLLLRMTTLAFAIPLGGAALYAITTALLEWDRKSELSADRAGLLAVQDPELALRVNMKLAGGGRAEQMNIDAFIAQAEEYKNSGSVVDGVVKLLNLIGRTHPFPVLRLAELKKWVESGDYDANRKKEPTHTGNHSPH
jgi:Zn-dependent protease with chaperone function